MAQYIKTEDGYKGLEESISAVTDGKMYSKMDKTNPTGTGSFSMNRKAGTVIGKNSHAEGDDTTASGYSSHAEGIDTTASGYSSHAEGNYTDASGDYSHAEGGSNKASGKYSHAEGNGTKASGYNSHAEGYQTTASEQGSHAEGYSTNRFSSVVTTTNPTTDSIITAWKNKKFSVAKGDYSHVEGKDNLALDDYSHAEGDSTTASGASSHAEGYWTTASGGRSHAEGNYTTASGDYSHAEGLHTTASGVCSHAEGYWTTASQTYSHAEGFNTTASGPYSHAEGYYTTAKGSNSHAEGYSTNMFSSVVTTPDPTTDNIINVWNTKKFSLANDNYSHVEGKDNLALGKDSHAEGGSTKASGDHSHTEGANTTASGLCSHAEGNITTASGTGSHVEGGSTKASGDYSHAEGIGTEASGSYSHAEGRRTKASGDNSHAQGKFNIEDTSNTYADIIGNGTSNTARSNAATVDWNGNAWFAGDVYTGSTSGTNKDDGSKKLATEEYVNSSIAAGGTDISLGLTSASVGQIIKVKAIDESGKPTAWEAAEMQSGGGDKWELINEITFSEAANGCIINTDSTGAAFSLKAAKVECIIQIVESDPFTYIKTKYNDLTVCANAQTNLKTGQVYFSSGALHMGPAGIMEIHTGIMGNNYNWTYTINKMGFRYNQDWNQNSINQIKIEPNDGGKPLGEGTKIYLYGVRA